MPSKTLPPVTNYLKNVVKSVAFVARDVVKEDLVPDVADFAEANKDFVKATVANIRIPSMKDRRNINAMLKSKIFQPVDYGFKNIMQDLKTGDFYARSREDQDLADLAGFDFGDLDDLSEFGIDSNWEKDLENGASSSNVITKGEAKIIESVEKSGAAQAQATVMAVVASNDKVVQNARANTAVLFQQQEKMFAGMHKDLSVIGATLTSMFKLTSTVMTNMDQNISKYQTESLKALNEQTAVLKEILEIQRNQYKSAQQKEMENARNRSSKRKRFGDLTFGGAVDLEGYFENIKENIKNEFGMGSDFFDQLKMAMVTPMRDVMKEAFKFMIPTMIKESSKDFTGMIGSIFANSMVKLNKHKDDFGILGYISRFLGINMGVNRTLDTGNYEKGPVPWDGISRKALTNVLPGYLSRIEAAITGEPAMDYNYDTGKWVRSRDQKVKIDNIKKQSAMRATYELMQSGFSSALDANAPTDVNKRKEFDLAVEEFRQYLYDVGGDFHPQESATYNGVSRTTYPNFYKYYNKIRKIYDEYDIVDSVSATGRIIGRFKSRDGKIHSKSGVKMGVARNVLQERDSEDRTYRNMEGSSHSSATKWAEYSNIHKEPKHDGKATVGGLGTAILEYKDKYGFTIHNYLHNINQELIFWRSNFGALTGGGGRRGRRNAPVRSYDSITLEDSAFVQARAAEEQARQAAQQEEAQRNAQNWKKMTMEDIQSGRITDLRHFRDYRSADFSYQLYRMSKADRERLFRDVMGSDSTMNEQAFEDFFKKQIKGANIRKLEDVQAAIDKANDTGKGTSEVLTREERGVLGKILNKVGGGKDLFNQLIHAPAEAFTNVLYAADRSVYEMFFEHKLEGTDGTKFTGFLDYLRGQTETLFDKLTKNLIDGFKEKIWSKVENFIKDHHLDEYFNRYKTALGDIFRGSKKVVTGAATDAFQYATNPIYGEMRTDIVKTHGANWDKLAKRTYYSSGEVKSVGRKGAVKKYRDDMYRAGVMGGDALDKRVASVGFKGSIQDKIQILSEYGIDSDRINRALSHAKSDEEANEILNKMFNRLDVRQHAKGTLVSKPYTGTTMLSKGELLFNRSGVSMVRKTGAYNITTPTDIMTSKDSADLLDSMGVKAGQSRKSVQRDQALENIEKKKIFGHAAGTFTRKDIINDREFTSEEAKQAFAQMKANVPEMLAGATVGSGASLLLGLVGGPLVGAAVGAGAMLIKRSEFVQKMLFGSIDGYGKRKNDGLINTKIQTAVKDAVGKYAPDMVRFGTLGLAASLITPLGPVGGLMVGSAVGFLKNNEEMREKLFGKLKIGDSEKSIIKRMLPGALKGAGVGVIATLFGGPFGLMGNAIVGSAIGMMASTDEFKAMMLGEKINGVTVGGIIGTIKDAFEPLREAGAEFKDRIFAAIDDNIIDPLANFIQPAIHMIPKYLGMLPTMIVDRALNSKLALGMSNLIQDRILHPLGNLLNPVAKLGGKAFRAATTPFRLVGAVGNKMHKGAIDRRQDDWELASERIAFNTDVLHRESSKYDLELARIGQEGGMSVEQAKNLSQALTMYNTSRTQLHKSRLDIEKQMKKLINSFKGADGKPIPRKVKQACLAAIQSGNPQKIPNLLKGAGLSNNDVTGLVNAFEPLITQWQEIYKKEQIARDLTDADKSKMGEDIQKVFKDRFGINDLNMAKPSELNKIAKQINMEVENREGIANAEAPEVRTSENVSDIKDILLQILKSGIKTVSPEDEADYNRDIEKLGKGFDKKNKGKDDLLAALGKSVEEGERVRDEFLGDHPDLEEGLSDRASDDLTRGRKFRNPLSYVPFLKNTNAVKRNMYIGRLRGGSMQKLFGRDGLTANAINAASEANKQRRLDLISKIKVDVKLDDDTSNRLVSITEFRLKRLVHFFAIGEVKSYCKGIGRPITFDEMNEISKFDVTRRNWQNSMKFRFKLVNKYKAYDKFPNIIDVINMTSDQERDLQLGSATRQPSSNLPVPISDQTTQPAEPEHHFLGTLLGLGGKLVGGIFKGISSLFGGGNKDQEAQGGDAQQQQAGMLGKVMSTIGGAASSIASGIGGAIGGEADKKGDNSSVVQTEYGPAKVSQEADGSVEYDTADNKTKAIVNKLTWKEKMQEKLMVAQEAASNAVAKALEVGKGVKTGAKKGFGWLSALLLGGMLLKSGILGKLWNNVIVPVWTKHVWPWLKDTAFPWIKDNIVTPLWENVLKPAGKWAWDNLLVPAGNWLLETALPKLGSILGEVLPGALSAALGGLGGLLSGLTGGGSGDGSWGSGIAGKAANVVGNVFDFFTGTNKKNRRTDTTIDASKVDESKMMEETEMYDENGRKLTYHDINTGNYTKIYNNEGKEGIVNEDGTVTFESGYIPGTNWAKKTANATVHAATQGGLGIADKAIGAVRGVSGFIAKHTHGLVLGTAAKAGNATVKATTAPAKAATGFSGWLQRTTLKSIEKAAENSGDVGAMTIVKKAIGEGAEAAAETAAKAGAKEPGKFSKLISKLSGWVTKGLTKIAESNVFKSKFAQAAIGFMKKPGELIEGFLKHAQTTFDDIIAKGCAKFGAEISAKVAAKLTIILAIIQVAADFGIGCDQAENILGVEDPSVLETIVAGTVNAIGNLIIVPAIWPGIPQTCQMLYKFFGDKLAERQAEAKAAYDKYVEETGSTWSFEEFMKRKYSLTGKVGGFIGDAASAVGGGIVKGAKAVGHAVLHPIETAKSAGKAIKGAAKAAGSAIVGAGKKTWDVVTHPVESVKAVGKAVGGAVTTAGKAIGNAATTAGGWVVDRAMDLGSGIASLFGGNKESLGTTIVNNIKNGNYVFTKDMSDDDIVKTYESNQGYMRDALIQKAQQLEASGENGYALELVVRYNMIKGIDNNAAGTFVNSALDLGRRVAGKAVNAAGNILSTGMHVLAPVTGLASRGIEKLTDLANRGQIINGNIINQISSLGNNNSPEGNIASIPLGISGIATGVIGLIGHGLGDVKDFINSTLTDLSKIKTTGTDKIIKEAKDGKVSVFSEDYWTTGLSTSNSTLASSIQAIYNGLIRVVNAPGLIISSMMTQLSSFFTAPISKIKDTMSSAYKSTTNYINQDGINLATGTSGATSITAASAGSSGSANSGGASAGQKVSLFTRVANTASKLVSGAKNVASGVVNTVRNTASNVWSGIKNFFGFGKGKYSKQNDPRIANIRYNSGIDTEYQTIGDSGCGPAAAVNVMESIYGSGSGLYGRGAGDIVNATNFALRHGYKETDGGTKPGFFTDYFARNGVSSETTYNRNNIENQIRSGQPTVLMGRDARGVSNSTPYGKVPHYVTVTGTIGKDYAVVQDPESRYDDQIYRIKDLARKSQIGISATGAFGHGKHGRVLSGFNPHTNKKYGRGKYGRGKSKIIMFGDSKTCGIYDVVAGGSSEQVDGKEDSNGNIWVAKVGAGLYNSTKSWINGTALNIINSKASGDYAIAILMGVNDISGALSGNNDAGAIKDWTEWINKHAPDWIKKGAEVYFVGAGPVEASGYKDQYADVQNSDLKHFNESVASGVSGSGVKFIDCFSLEGNVKCVDGLHYNSETYKKMWELVSTAITNGQASTVSGGTASDGSTSGGTTSSGGDNRNMLLFEAHYKKNRGSSSSSTSTVASGDSAVSMATSSSGSNSSSGSTSSGSSTSTTYSGQIAEATSNVNAAVTAGNTASQSSATNADAARAEQRAARQYNTATNRRNQIIHNNAATNADAARAEQRMGRTNNKKPTTNTSNKPTNSGGNIFTNAWNAVTGWVGNLFNGKGKYGRGGNFTTMNGSDGDTSIGGFLSNVIANSAAAQVLNSFLDVGGSPQTETTQEQTTTTTDSGSTSTSSGVISVGGKYQSKKYNLNDTQITQIANAMQCEQGGDEGIASEASLAANLLETRSAYQSAYGDDFVRFMQNAGWFAGVTRQAAHNTSKSNLDSQSYYDVVKDVLVNGNRVFPQGIDEHDCFSDISSATNDGVGISVSDRSSYKPGVTKLHNVYGSNYTFYAWANPSTSDGDPFGYTKSPEGSGGNGIKPISLYGRAKEGGLPIPPKKTKRVPKVGMYAGMGKFGRGRFGRGNRAAEVWNWFTTHGYSDSATAAILGNMEQESGIDPEAIQGNGAGPAAGIVQWENYNTKSSRWLNMSQYAQSKGRDWKDLESQLEFVDKELNGPDTFWQYASTYTSYDAFKKATDIGKATEDFEKSFERAGTPMMENRLSAAQKYYTQFNGTGGTPISGSVNSTGGGSSSGGGGSSSGNGGDGLSSIGQWLSNVLANSPAAQVLNSFLDVGGGGGGGGGNAGNNAGNSSTSASGASGSAAKVVSVAEQELATADQERASGKVNNTIENNRDNNVKYNTWYYGKEVSGSQYPWCAAFVSWVTNHAGIPESIFPKDAYTVTAYQYVGEHGGTYPKNSEGKPGDIAYFSDNGQPSGIYHTGIVKNVQGSTINTIEGNSSDAVNARQYDVSSSKVLLARPAYAVESATTTSTTTSTTDTTSNTNGTVSDAPDVSDTRGGNGIKPISRFNKYKNALYGMGATPHKEAVRTTKIKLKDKEGYHTVEYSGWDKKAGNEIKNFNRAGGARFGRGSELPTGVSFYGMGGNTDYSGLIKQIVEILLKVASNTDKLNTIASILQEKLNLNVSAQDVANAQNGSSSSEQLARALMNANATSSKMNTYADTVGDSSIHSIITAMNAIAAE